MILKYDWRDVPLFSRAKAHIRDVDTVLDVGAGLRPQSLVTCKRHICMEAHGEYCDALREGGFDAIHFEVPAGLDLLDEGPIDTVVALDVIEHLTRRDGLAMIEKMKRLATQQVIVFTPLGFHEQSGGDACDAWGMQGQQWQKHRSGWTPEDFPGWLHLVDEHFAPGHAAFVAIWNRE